MKFIFTSATAVQKIKMAAKAIARNCNISHTKALELAAKEAGYTDWFHVRHCLQADHAIGVSQKPLPLAEKVLSYSQYLGTLPRASVKFHDCKGDVFHDISIEGHRFRGKVLPTGEIWILKLITQPLLMEDAGVSLGVASIRHCNPQKITTNGEWWICKYSTEEPRLDLENLTDSGRNALSYEFGLPLIPKEGLPDPKEIWSTFVFGHESDLFYMSPAFTKLVEWARRHPRKARASSSNSNYLRQWMEVAMKHPSFIEPVGSTPTLSS